MFQVPLELRVTSDQVWSLVTQNQNCGHSSNWAVMLLCVLISFSRTLGLDIVQIEKTHKTKGQTIDIIQLIAHMLSSIELLHFALLSCAKEIKLLYLSITDLILSLDFQPMSNERRK